MPFIKTKWIPSTFVEIFQLIRWFKSQPNFGNTILFAFLLVIRASHFFAQHFTASTFFELKSSNTLFSFTITTLIIFLLGLLLNNIANRYSFFDTPSNFPAAVFYCFSPFFPMAFQLHPWWLVIIFSLLILNKILKAYLKSRPGKNFFDASFLITCSAFIFPQYLLYIIALLLCVFIVAQPLWAYFKLILVGIVFPFIWLFVYLIITEQQLALFFKMQELILSLTELKTFSLSFFSIPLIFVVLLFIISYLFWSIRKPYLQNMQLPILRGVSIIVIFGILIAILFLPFQVETLIGVYLSLSLLVSFLLYYTKKNLASVLFLFLTGFAIVYPWLT